MLELYVQGAEGERLQMQIDSEKAHLTIQGTPCRLTEQEFQLLYVLAEKANQILSRDELLRTVWGFVTPCPTRTVDVHIQRIRKKTGLTCIETVLGRGYRLCAPENMKKY